MRISLILSSLLQTGNYKYLSDYQLIFVSDNN